MWWDFEDVPVWSGWLAERGHDAAAAGASYANALDLQRVLRGLEAVNNGASPTGAEIAALNSAIWRYDIRPRVGGDGSVSFDPAKADDALGRVLGMVVRALTEGTWRRFKLCRDDTCRASYFDATKNGAKTWCSMDTCGSRNKMRRFRARSGTTPD